VGSAIRNRQLKKPERHDLDRRRCGTADCEADTHHNGAIAESDKCTSDDERNAEIEKCYSVAKAITGLPGDEDDEERGDAWECKKSPDGPVPEMEILGHRSNEKREACRNEERESDRKADRKSDSLLFRCHQVTLIDCVAW
jgi:hypothetical protein